MAQHQTPGPYLVFKMEGKEKDELTVYVDRFLSFFFF